MGVKTTFGTVSLLQTTFSTVLKTTFGTAVGNTSLRVFREAEKKTAKDAPFCSESI